ncbi:hypothetical protein MRB53_003504 [Persea americana]|uniref:Uncharacterized protein n=1 Tax=Persea americana TaxID=3435 RepID=A0ACC2MYL2_PERAE|nr:hypothetical protein MRB53_003504 [Persea americana]
MQLVQNLSILHRPFTIYFNINRSFPQLPTSSSLLQSTLNSRSSKTFDARDSNLAKIDVDLLQVSLIESGFSNSCYDEELKQIDSEERENELIHFRNDLIRIGFMKMRVLVGIVDQRS